METATVPTVGELLNRFQHAHFPKLAIRTQKDGMRHVEILTELWGDVPADKLTPKMIGQWMNGGPARGKIQRGKIVSVLATMYKYAVGEWFEVEVNPTRDLRMPKAGKRTRYITDAELEAVKAICSPRLRAAMELALLTGQRQGDLLKMRWDHIDVNKKLIHVRQGKSIRAGSAGKRFAISISPALEEVLVRCKRQTPAFPREYVIRNKLGSPYTSAGFRALFQRHMRKAVVIGAIKSKYTFHDIRAKSASDTADINKASERLGHQSVQMTKSVYDRNIRIVEPLR